MPNTPYDYDVYQAENTLADETRIYNNMEHSPAPIGDFSFQCQAETIQDAENALIEAQHACQEYHQATGEVPSAANEGSTWGTLDVYRP